MNTLPDNLLRPLRLPFADLHLPTIMSDANPYTSPENCEEVSLATAADVEQWVRGLYRKGNQLVMHKMARLPDRCVKTNKPAGGRRVCRHFVWVHPLVWLSLPLGGVPFLILAPLLRKESIIYVALSEDWLNNRRHARKIGWWLGLIGAAIAVPFYAILASTDGQSLWAAGPLALSVAATLGAIIYSSMASYMVRPVRITDDYVWLKGVHPDYLADLPPWPNRP
jgi:hypothetical protein